MTLDEALSKAVDGFKVRHNGMTNGAYIYYNFKGFRIQFADIQGRIGGGSSSLWAGPVDDDKEADWYVLDADPNKPWPDFVQTNWDVDAAVDKIDPEEPFICPSSWGWPEEEPAKADSIKAGWAMFDKERTG